MLAAFYLLPVPARKCAKNSRSAHGDNFQPLVTQMSQLLLERALRALHLGNGQESEDATQLAHSVLCEE